MNVLIVCAYNLAILAGTAWLVWHGWSPWWFAFTVMCGASFKDVKGSKDGQ